jgi:hypothetical protein
MPRWRHEVQGLIQIKMMAGISAMAKVVASLVTGTDFTDRCLRRRSVFSNQSM